MWGCLCAIAQAIEQQASHSLSPAPPASQPLTLPCSTKRGSGDAGGVTLRDFHVARKTICPSENIEKLRTCRTLGEQNTGKRKEKYQTYAGGQLNFEALSYALERRD